ncbi:porin [Thiogranum longum]|nr:porin [Thiogranum longum]
MKRSMKTGISLAAALLTTTAGAAQLPSPEVMWDIIQKQQKEIDALKAVQKDTDEKVEATVQAIEEQTTDGSHGTSLASGKTRVGGYGELHYNNLDTDNGSEKSLDFHRFVLFFGHQFTDRLRFFSELELEHAFSQDTADGSGKGEVELEQAYIEYDLNDRHHVRGGVSLIPVGILNETHEPPTFYGVERNPVEKNIIPATWWAAGVGARGEIAPGWGYDVSLHEGLNNSAYNIRKGRQKSAEADAHDLASTARIKWTGVAGIELAASIQYQQNITQGIDNDASAWLYEAHADIQRGPFGLRALYAMWDIDGSGAKAVGADQQEGFYIEPSYKVTPKFGVFARYNQYDNAAGNNADTGKKQYDVGVNYWLNPDVVLKADYQKQDNESNTGEKDGFNLGIGYQF